MLSPYPPPATFEKRPSIFQRIASAVLPVPRARPFAEMGVSGTATWGGYVWTQEKSVKWIGREKYVTISNMVVNASIVAAGFHYFLNLVAHPQWTLEPADESAEAKAAAEFVEEVLHGTDAPWSRVVRRAATYRFFGFGVQEWTARRRPDGRIGLASVEPRPQHTIEQWALADDGSVEGVFQRSPTTGELLGLPRSKFLYLVDNAISDSPEGTGVFRMLADPWERLQMYHDLEARAFERDLRGVPVGRVPYSLIRQEVAAGRLKQSEADTLVQGMEEFVKLQVKKSNTSITLDSVPYYSQAADGSKVAAVPQWGLELLQGSATGVEHLGAAITRTQHEMARVIGTESLLMGENSGNRALSEDKSKNLYLVANAVLSEIAAGVDQDIVARMCDLNGIPEELRPKCKPEEVSFKDAETVANVLAKMAQAGAVLAPDDPVNADVRTLMGVSVPSPVATDAVPAGGAASTEEEAAAAAEEELSKTGPRTLYVKRRLLNADAVRAWAAEQGIASTLAPDDMHVTVAFSREPVDWSALCPDEHPLTVAAGERSAHQFPPRSTPNSAFVLKFESPALHARWQALRDAGASWDFPEYTPHVTLTYSVPEADAAKIEPYAGPLVFGPEEFAEVDDGWAGEIKEMPTVEKRGWSRFTVYPGDLVVEDDNGTAKRYDPSQPRDEDGKWTDSGAGGAGYAADANFAGLTSLEGSINRDERDAVEVYVASNKTATIQAALREGRTPRGANADRIAKIDSAISKSIVQKDVLTHRGVSAAAWDEFVAAASESSVVRDPGFVSTSLDSSVVDRFAGPDGGRFTVQVPAGTSALAVTGRFKPRVYRMAGGRTYGAVGSVQSEREVLLPRGARMSVVSIDRVNRVAVLRVLPTVAKMAENHPRVPAGSPHGGEWTDGGGGSAGEDAGVRALLDKLPAEARTEDGAASYLARSLKEMNDRGDLVFYHEGPGDLKASFERAGIKGDYGVFARINEPSNFVTTKEKTIVAFKIPRSRDLSDMVGPDMRYGHPEDLLTQTQMMLIEHPNVRGADVSIALDSIPPSWLVRVEHIKKRGIPRAVRRPYVETEE